jgi:uncharacterized protein (TIGR00369 family)
LQDFGDCIQSSQIGPHLVQPLRTRPSATTLKISAISLNITRPALDLFPRSPIVPAGVGHFQAIGIANPMPQKEPPSMQREQPAAACDIDEARRVLGEVFAPWVRDLNLSIEAVECVAAPDAAPGWQPGAILRMPLSERLCRNGGIISGQALMAFADTAMVMAFFAANGGYRPMTTVDQTTHFMRAATASDVLAEARVVRLGRTMGFGRVTLSSAADNKPVAMVSSAFAML